MSEPHFSTRFQVMFWCSLIRSFVRFFVLRFCFYESETPIFNIETKPQLSFAASVLKDVTNVLPKYFSTVWSFLLWGIGFLNLWGNFTQKKRRVLSLYLYSNDFQSFGIVTSDIKCFVIQVAFRTKSFFCLKLFSPSRTVKEVKGWQ